MDTDADKWESDLTEAVIGAAFEVANGSRQGRSGRLNRMTSRTLECPNTLVPVSRAISFQIAADHGNNGPCVLI